MYFNKSLFFCLIFILNSPLSFAGNQVVHYEPEIVRLEGVVDIQTFPGRPNYESIKNGDEMERGAYLKLNRPIDVHVMPDDQNNETEKNVKIMQIVDGNRLDWQKFKRGNHLRITGTLFHRLTGHHHSRVLIEVRQVEKV